MCFLHVVGSSPCHKFHEPNLLSALHQLLNSCQARTATIFWRGNSIHVLKNSRVEEERDPDYQGCDWTIRVLFSVTLARAFRLPFTLNSVGLNLAQSNTHHGIDSFERVHLSIVLFHHSGPSADSRRWWRPWTHPCLTYEDNDDVVTDVNCRSGKFGALVPRSLESVGARDLPSHSWRAPESSQRGDSNPRGTLVGQHRMLAEREHTDLAVGASFLDNSQC